MGPGAGPTWLTSGPPRRPPLWAPCPRGPEHGVSLNSTARLAPVITAAVSRQARMPSTRGGWRSTRPRRPGSQPPASACAPPGPVIELGQSLGDGRLAVHVEAQQLAYDVRLRLHHLGLPIPANRIPIREGLLQHTLVISRRRGEDRHGQIRILHLPRLDVDADDFTGVLPGEHYQVSLQTPANDRGRPGHYLACRSEVGIFAIPVHA